MREITRTVDYTAACPNCGEDAMWRGKSIAERVPMSIQSAQSYYDEHVTVSVCCWHCDEKEVVWCVA